MSETSQLPQYKEGDIAWMLTSTAFVWLMVILSFSFLIKHVSKNQ
jgi:ammonia channel protein AmtB